MTLTDEQVHRLRLFLQQMKLEQDYYASQSRPYDAEEIEEILCLDPVPTEADVLLEARRAADMTASNLIADKRKPKPSLKAIYPPRSASMDPVQFANWLKEVGIKLLRAGIEVKLIPMVNADESLFLGVEVDDTTARALKAALYN